MPQYSCWARQYDALHLISDHSAQVGPHQYPCARFHAVRLVRDPQATCRARALTNLCVAIPYVVRQANASPQVVHNHARSAKPAQQTQKPRQRQIATSTTTQIWPGRHVHPAAGHQYALIETPSFPHGETIFHAYPRLSRLPSPRCFKRVRF